MLLRVFRLPLGLLIGTMIGSALLYSVMARHAGVPINSLAEAVYLMLSLTFLQSSAPFPRVWYLQVFYFFMPLVGIGILAHGLADFGVLLFNRRTRNREWEMALAETFHQHVILIGLGHLGVRVVQLLYEMEKQVVVIERTPLEDILRGVRELGYPVVEGDASRETTLEAAGVQHARCLVVCTQNDNLNLQIAVKARSLNPDLRVVVRIFDHDFARALTEQFGYQALSSTGMAAPAFAAAATGVDITRPITVEGEPLSLARLNVERESKLIGKCVSEIEAGYDVSVVLLRNRGVSDLHPPGSAQLAAGDVVAILGGPQQIGSLVHDNQG